MGPSIETTDRSSVRSESLAPVLVVGVLVALALLMVLTETAAVVPLVTIGVLASAYLLGLAPWTEYGGPNATTALYYLVGVGLVIVLL